MKHKLYAVIGTTLIFIGLIGSPLVAFAADSKSSDKSSTSDQTKTLNETGLTPQPYGADSILKTGTIVQPNDKDAGKVQPASQKELDKAFGVVASTNQLAISITSTSGNQVFVATTGNQQALVTSENGVIKSGDYLAVSSLSGTLMKANDKQKIVFGKALANFDGKNNIIATKTLNDTSGKPIKKIGIGLIPIAIQIIKNPEVKSTKSKLPQALQRIGQAIAEKPVSAVRIYISTAIIVICIMLALTLLYAGIRSAIISIGRNPLSKKSIFRALLEVILTSVLVLIIGLFTVYLILRL